MCNGFYTCSIVEDAQLPPHIQIARHSQLHNLHQIKWKIDILHDRLRWIALWRVAPRFFHAQPAKSQARAWSIFPWSPSGISMPGPNIRIAQSHAKCELTQFVQIGMWSDRIEDQGAQFFQPFWSIDWDNLFTLSQCITTNWVLWRSKFDHTLKSESEMPFTLSERLRPSET